MGNLLQHDNALVGHIVGFKDMGVVSIPLNDAQIALATDKNPDSMNASWDRMCDSLVDMGFMDIRGRMNIDQIVINGVAKDFL